MRPTISHNKGFTLLELIIASAIIGVISAISAASYTGYIDTTNNSQAASQIRTLAILIDDYALEYGEYPESLHDIGNENLKDPWGNPYVYLNLNSKNGQGNSDHDDNDEDGGSDESGGSDEYGGSGDGEHDGMGGHDGMDGMSGHDGGGEGGSDGDHGGGDTNIGGARKDGNLVPINTNYDLCSFGKDSKSKAPLRAKDSKDDIIYANDGGYIGLASEF